MEKVILFSPDASLGSALRAARLRRGLTLEGLALRVHCAPRTIERLELGQTKTVNLSLISQISRELRSPLVLKLAIRQIQASFPPVSDPAPAQEVA
ncbi:MAG: helix-turn-helix transcriptional regulator [Sulfobacillus sp.]|nr:helix-turn-helix transcriptional regulator [Sulfobacillus sp.]